MPTIWALPNFTGELFTADALNTPLLTMSGGLTGGKRTANFEFPTSSEYTLPAAAQNVVSETASIAAPVAVNIPRAQVNNTCQIHQHAIQVTYQKLANMGRLSGLNTANVSPNVQDEVDWQVDQKLKVIARDTEFSFVQGTYVQAVNAGVVGATRGMVEVCQLAGGTNVNGQAAQLALPLMQSTLLAAHTAGAQFSNMILYVGGALKQRLSAIYGFAPTSRVIGGVDVEQLETDFGNIGIVLSRFAVANTVLGIEMDVVSPVFQEIPGKGNLFYEELAKTGASESGQIYGHIGFDHGPAFAHFRLFNVTA